MNYFELYDLPISFNPDQGLIKQQFYALSKKYHPDYYINESEEKQEEVLALSTLNNKAFQVLKDPQKRLHYILSLKNQLIEGEHYSLPQSFLMEMMKVNEALMELEFEPNDQKLSELRTQVEEISDQLTNDLHHLTLRFDQGNDAKEPILVQVKDLYYRNKYLYRIKESLHKFK